MVNFKIVLFFALVFTGLSTSAGMTGIIQAINRHYLFCAKGVNMLRNIHKTDNDNEGINTSKPINTKLLTLNNPDTCHLRPYIVHPTDYERLLDESYPRYPRPFIGEKRGGGLERVMVGDY